MKIALILGRGVEGAGVTRYMIEICSFLKTKDIEHDVFVVEDKKWGRGKAQDMPKYRFIDKENIVFMADTLNLYDYVFINSVPSVKHSQWAQDGFLEMVKGIKTKKIVFQNDHKIASIWRNANFFEICNQCDGICSHSITSPFMNKLASIYGSEIKDKFIQLHVGFNFEQLTKYRKSEHFKKITYLGRFATFKQPERLYGFLPYAKQNNLLLEMKGVERSLGALKIFYEDLDSGSKEPNHKMIEVNRKVIENGLDISEANRNLDKVYIFGPYDYIDGMETLSSSLVGADFYHLNADAYGDNFEYAQCEIIGVGCVPMFDYHWAENCWVYHDGKKTEKRFVDLDEYGLFVKKDLTNVEEVVEKINDIYSNKALHKRFLDCSFEVTRNHCDSQWIFQKLLDDVLVLEKTKVIKPKSLF